MVNLKPEEKDAIINWWKLEPKSSGSFLKAGRAKECASLYHISVRRLHRIVQEYLMRHPNADAPPNHVNGRIGKCGQPSGLIPLKRKAMLAIIQEHIDNNIYCSDRMLREGMAKRGHRHSLSCIQKWKKMIGEKNV